MKNIGVLSKEKAISYGFTGPLLRACGVPYDIRRADPHLVYDELDFEIPIGEVGDSYDRFLVRMEEMRQSISIIEQAIDKIPYGPVMTRERYLGYPDKKEVYGSIEGLDRPLQDGDGRPPSTGWRSLPTHRRRQRRTWLLSRLRWFR